jgi:hypothetical protein
MKFMKKLVVLVCVAFMGIISTDAQIVWGGRVGVCYSTISAEGGASVSGNAGLEIGPVLYYSLKNNIYINSGAMFSVKNFSEGDESINLYYIEVPLYVGYAFPIGGLDFYAQAGPYAGFKIAESVPWDGDSGVNAFNAGLGIVGGINIKKFKIEIGYQQGLVNVIDTDGFKATMGSLFLGVSYVF